MKQPTAGLADSLLATIEHYRERERAARMLSTTFGYGRILLANSEGLRWPTPFDEAAIERLPFVAAFLQWLQGSQAVPRGHIGRGTLPA
jgi:hypothetical protein